MIAFRVARRLIRNLLKGMLHRWPTTLVAFALVLGGTWALASRGLIAGLPEIPGLPSLSPTPKVGESDMREMTVEDLSPSASGQQINLTLKEKGGNRRIVMVVGPGEARAIAIGMGNRRAEGPVSYDLTKSLVEQLGGSVSRVVVNNVDRDSYYAKVVMTADSRQIEVDSRPSDAIALAVRAKAPIYADIAVLEKAGVASSN